jgi:hypothetical protein
MSINSRNIGRRGENELSKVLNDYGFTTERMSQYCGKTGVPDVQGLPHIHIECKRVEALNMEKAYEQSSSDSLDGEMPTVMHRKNRGKWMVTMSLEDWVKLYEVWLCQQQET